MTPMTRKTWDMADGREALELIKQPVPHSAPERNLLAIGVMILDISQGIDSTVPTMSKKARRELTVTAKLMGSSIDHRGTDAPHARNEHACDNSRLCSGWADGICW